MPLFHFEPCFQTANIYLVGTPPEEEGLNSLLLESDIHGDLAISQNIDTYQVRPPKNYLTF